MYGLVNQGVQSFITESFGPADWEDLCRRAGIQDAEFDSMVTYPDDVTYGLVAAICEKYGMRADEALRVFGGYWVGFTAETQIGKLMQFGGQSLFDRLAALDEMHDRIRLSMPHLKPPSFEFEDMGDGSGKLHYASDREGLESMVIGLVEGLARDTGEEITITQDPEPAYPGLRATFTVRHA